MIPAFDKKRYSIVRDILSSMPYRISICDVGSGKYPITDRVLARKKITMDIDKQNKPDVVLDVSEGIPSKYGKFDVVVACEILEHIFDNRKFLNSIYDILNEDGILVLSSPNICSFRYRLAFLAGKIPAHASKGSINGHVRDYNLNELRDLLENHCFRIESLYGDGMWLGCFGRVPVPLRFSDSMIIKARRI